MQKKIWLVLAALLLACATIPAHAGTEYEIDMMRLEAPKNRFPQHGGKAMSAVLAQRYPVDDKTFARCETKTYEVISETHVLKPQYTVNFASGAVVLHKGVPRLLTAWHVSNTNGGKMYFRARDYRGNVFPLKLLATDRDHDLALFAIMPEEKIQPETVATPATSNLNTEYVLHCGYYGGKFFAKKGKLTRLFKKISISDLLFYTMFASDAQTANGFSGGPVLSDDGSLLGINVGHLHDYSESYFSSHENILSFLK